MIKSGAQIVIECLLEQGVDTVFGFPGGQIIDVYDALYEYKDRVKHILTSHEQGAAHAADGYARATGKVGVVIATSGPGATNLVTGIANAYMDSIPLVAITGNVPVPLLGRDSFQEIDITGVTMPITKHNYIVKDIKDLARIIREAFYVAREGRPGPVLVDIPRDIAMGKTEFEFIAQSTVKIFDSHIDKEQIEVFAKHIAECKAPVIFAGGGIISSDASKELEELSAKIDAPVTLSFMGLGALSSENPKYLGMLGMHGTLVANNAVKHCDLLIAVGTRFSDRVTGNKSLFAKNAKILHIDIDPAEINKNINTYECIIGDVKSVLKELIKAVEAKKNAEWEEEIDTYKEKYAHLKLKHSDIMPKKVLAKIRELTGEDDIITTEVGQHQMWTAQYFNFKKPRTFISSGGLGTMGFGLGAAIGSKLGKPQSKVVCISGDGSFHMNLNEIATAVTYQIPIVIVVMNNGVLGMVRQWQKVLFEKRFSNTTLNRKTDFVKLAEAFGAKGLRIKDESDIEKVLKEALSSDIPVVIDCIIPSDDNVLPMIPAGKSLEDVITVIDN